MHLKLTHIPAKGWTCAALYTTVEFGFGTFRWFVEGAIDKFDQNVILGLFTYGGIDYINEIDIEIAKFGRNEPDASNLYYTVYPRELGVTKKISFSKRVTLQGTYTTHQFEWTPEYVTFQSQHGFRTSPNENVYFSVKTPANFSSSIPYLSAPLRLNLFTFRGRPPTNGQEVEIVIHDFQYTEA